jgi:uncharacterized protein (TIGR02145 family)
MRYSLFALILLLTHIQPWSLNAQDTIGISYQAIVRTAEGTVTNDTVGVQVSILQGSETGEAVYTERHTQVTGSTGLLTFEIGTGTPTNGTFSDIDWSTGLYYIKSEIDPTGNSSYTITGTFQLLSVPYALHAQRTGRSSVGGSADGVALRKKSGSDTLYIGADSVLIVIPGLDSANPPTPTFPEAFVHCDTAVTQIVTVTSTTGEIWMDRNLGASRVAESSTDNLAYGSLFQWGRFADGHQCRNSVTTSTLASTSAPTTDQAWSGKFILLSANPYDWLSTPDTMLWQGVNGINNPCPTGFRLPTTSEWETELNSWPKDGVKITSKSAYNSPLKLPVSGARLPTDGEPTEVGTHGAYWSSSVTGISSYYLYFYSNTNATMGPGYRGYGIPVRCLKD